VAELQAILPPGFTANPLPPPNLPGQAPIALLFAFQGRCELLASGTISGPASGLFAVHTARNTALNRNELLILAAEFSDASFVNCVDALWGPGSAHLADVEVKIKEKGGRLELGFDVEDESIGLDIKAQATSSGPIVARGAHADPAGDPQRSLNEGTTANAAFRYALMADNLVVPTAAANFRLKIRGRGDDDDDGDGAHGRLGLPGGRVRVIGVGPTVAFFRWFELFNRPE
jgi:hypothetical protein